MLDHLLYYSQKINKPYTYFIKWTKLNKCYYGVRYAKNSIVGDIMIDYFTSSKRVHQYINEHGKPDIILVDKIFDDKETAITNEHLYLIEHNCMKNDEYLNICNGIPRGRTDYTVSEKTRLKISNTLLTNGGVERSRNANIGKPCKQETKEKLRLYNLGKTHSEETKKKN